MKIMILQNKIEELNKEMNEKLLGTVDDQNQKNIIRNQSEIIYNLENELAMQKMKKIWDDD